MNNHTTGHGDHSPTIDPTRIPLFRLTWPILVENILRVSLSSVDVLMLSFYSAKAVAAMGIILQFVFFLQLLYLMVATGASILISQNLGARRSNEAGLIALACDEWIRGMVMLFRWRSGRWRTKALVTVPPIPTELP